MTDDINFNSLSPPPPFNISSVFIPPLLTMKVF